MLHEFEGVTWQLISRPEPGWEQPETWVVHGAPNEAFVNLPYGTPRPGMIFEQEGRFEVRPANGPWAEDVVPDVYESREDAMRAENAKERARARAAVQAVAEFCGKAVARSSNYAKKLGA